LREDADLQSITDGEFRRESFTHDLINSIDGAEFQRIPEQESGTRETRGRPPFRALISKRMQRPQAEVLKWPISASSIQLLIKLPSFAFPRQP
jgi:methionine synthase II (cobalamin-independent)